MESANSKPTGLLPLSGSAVPPSRVVLARCMLAILLAIPIISYQTESLAHQPEVSLLPPRPAEQIGGDFTLVNHRGETVTNRDFQGYFLLVFFGFTHCSDICPLSMQNLTLSLEQLGERASRIKILFVTVDPGRDSPAALADYVSYFHPNTIGLTGSSAQIEAVAEAYRVRYESGRNGRANLEDNYRVDHSAYIYLMGPDGVYRHAFHHAASSQAITTKLHEVIESEVAR